MFLFINYNGDIMSKEEFKKFAKLHPELANPVRKGTTSWQKLYELYDIYGETSDIWNEYFEQTSKDTFKDLFKTFKNLDIETVKKGVTNIQKTINLLQELGLSKQEEKEYEPRPIYRRFED